MPLIDLFDDRYEHIGTEDKEEAHRRGLWHRTFSALALNPTPAESSSRRRRPAVTPSTDPTTPTSPSAATTTPATPSPPDSARSTKNSACSPALADTTA